ncbi:MAG: type IX secretion system membrane protein PorP/SprF, partial [Ignavibacteria bacterium]|nr:type IX secretion system membrane protein PorP/SprF [Ignavibacteria bacterium]
MITFIQMNIGDLKILLFVFLLTVGSFLSGDIQAQQHPQYSLFNYNINTYNPAFTGINNNFSVIAHGRAQWLGINGYPFSQNLVIQMPLYGIRGGIGLTLMNNQQGLQRNTHAGIDYALIVRKPKYIFSIGI